MSTKYPQDKSQLPSKSWSTNATAYVKCPRCGAEPGYHCVMPSGRRFTSDLGDTHGAREQALVQERPDIYEQSKIQPTSAGDAMAEILALTVHIGNLP